MKNLKIAYITETSPFDKHAWSGTAHYIFKSLEDIGHTVIPLGPAKPFITDFFCKLANQFCLRILKKRFDYRHSAIYSKAFGIIFSKKLKQLDYDILLVVGGTEYAAYLKTTKPIYIIVDRTIEGAINYHSILSNLLPFSQKQSIATDKKAMLDSRKVFFSSDWARNHALQFYNLPLTKSLTLPFGANIDIAPTAEMALNNKNENEWKLLFIGTSWKNKGAEIAINTLKYLKQKNINASLTIVGCSAPYVIEDKSITIIPFIDKNSSNGMQQLWELFMSHHFFILPTRFDCTPIVFCESSSFGVPILTSNTGGVEGHIKQGKNGFLIPYDDDGKLFSEKINEIITTPGMYQQLRISTRKLYDEALNWEKWANRFTKEVESSL